MADQIERPAYSREQIEEYLDFIDQGKVWKGFDDLENAVRLFPLKTLDRLQRKQMAAVPFGNLILHYSQHHSISLDTDILFHKIVRRKMGGYCLENNAFFAAVLRSIGYTFVTGGARVSNYVSSGGKNTEGFKGWSHMIILVTIHQKRYLVDVGFGGNSACHPAELLDGAAVGTVPTSEGRLSFRNISGSVDSGQKLWVLETRNDKESPWMPSYCFAELEFLPGDYEMMNFSCSKSASVWFTYKILLTKIILSEEDEEPIGTITLNEGEIKRRWRGKSVIVEQCKSENQRVQALKRWFDIELTTDEIRGISGMVTELGNCL
ncbi:MAG: hypothetical protein Q9227_008439 [Pyrenula ochraceoflavens]